MKIINSKIFKILVVTLVIGFIIGIISFIFMDKTSLQSSIINYINLIKNDSYNYSNGLISSIISNIKYSSIIWISGIIFFCSLIIPLIIIYRGISLSLTISTIIYTYKLKGTLYALIIVFPTMLNEIIFLFLSYYSINFSIKCYNTIKNNKDINLRLFIKNYFYIFLILSLLLIISSIIEIYLCSNIIKYVV
ncbi:MAG: stage II sporulation protein M [Mollicutes bacterium]|nr:stage II sporulation protein M [Mollicutes bacterium]